MRGLSTSKSRDHFFSKIPRNLHVSQSVSPLGAFLQQYRSGERRVFFFEKSKFEFGKWLNSVWRRKICLSAKGLCCGRSSLEEDVSTKSKYPESATLAEEGFRPSRARDLRNCPTHVSNATSTVNRILTHTFQVA